MGIDLQLLQNDKGGNFEGVCASQKKRFASEELVHDVLAQYKEWTKSAFPRSQRIRRLLELT